MIGRLPCHGLMNFERLSQLRFNAHDDVGALEKHVQVRSASRMGNLEFRLNSQRGLKARQAAHDEIGLAPAEPWAEVVRGERGRGIWRVARPLPGRGRLQLAAGSSE